MKGHANRALGRWHNGIDLLPFNSRESGAHKEARRGTSATF
jgi:hypothetical protein